MRVIKNCLIIWVSYFTDVLKKKGKEKKYRNIFEKKSETKTKRDGNYIISNIRKVSFVLFEWVVSENRQIYC